ncbi:hypothetical protein CK203_047496 [Vitis vinifera]|uniref:Uncharacterized protein n=1 Tax=Vitis vinifera TaxID=29760 RepID=A0A438H661_VITVI|nr:hypothetical protein CK203_047496 [Vitis vinifera]
MEERERPRERVSKETVKRAGSKAANGTQRGTSSKGGVSSWIKLGPASLGPLIEGLGFCSKDMRTGHWEKRWQESGRFFSLERGENKGGCFLKLGALREIESISGRQVRQQDKEFFGHLEGKVLCGGGKAEPQHRRRGGEGACGQQCIMGNLGLAKLEDGKALLEFGLLSEAEKALDMAEISVGGFVIRLEKWSPRSGCLMEEDKVREAWVRIVGLPISLWNRDILSKVGEACGGFLGMDVKTERMEELQWARIRADAERVADGREREIGCTEGEVEGEAHSREGKRVKEAKGGSWPEVQLQSADGTERLTSGSGRPMECSRGPYGLQLKPQGTKSVQSGQVGLGSLMRPCGSEGFIQSSSSVASLGPKENRWIEAWRPSWSGTGRAPPLERSKTDLALVEEASRYVMVQSECLTPCVSLFLSFFFGSDSSGEYCDLSGHGEKRDEDENPLQMLMGMEPPVSEPVECWDLVEVGKDRIDVTGKGLDSDQIVPMGNKAGGELSWEKSDLAKFSKFLGFSTEGLEKDIMEFLVKIRKEGKVSTAKPFWRNPNLREN